MTDQHSGTPSVRVDAQQPAKAPWVAPVVKVIVAGEAEAGTRSNGHDGYFTTS